MPRTPTQGFTLVELMITIAVLAILLALAVPAFNDFRQRTALRGAADQVSAFVADTRFEALKRDALVKLVVKTSGNEWCLGSTPTTDATDNTTCDCFTQGACSIASYPSNQSEWRGVTPASNPTLGEGDGASAVGVVVFNPKRGGLSQSDDEGRVLLQAPPGPMDYRMNIVVDRNGRALLCEPSAAPSKLSDYADRQC